MLLLGGLGGQSGLEPRRNLVTVCAPLGGVDTPVTVGGRLLRDLQALGNLSQVDTLRSGEGDPGLTDSLAPGSPFSTGGLGVGERGEGGSILGAGDGLASDLGVVVLLPLGSVIRPVLGCKGKSDCQS